MSGVTVTSRKSIHRSAIEPHQATDRDEKRVEKKPTDKNAQCIRNDGKQKPHKIYTNKKRTKSVCIAIAHTSAIEVVNKSSQSDFFYYIVRFGKGRFASGHCECIMACY